MPKFLVYIDSDKPYEVESPSRVDATLDAMEAHRKAKRITVKPKSDEVMRQDRSDDDTPLWLKLARITNGIYPRRVDAERIREGGKA